MLVPASFFLARPKPEIIKKGKLFFLSSWIVFCLFSLCFLLYNWLHLPGERHFYNFIQTSMHHNYMPQDSMYINTGLIFLLFSDIKNIYKWVVSLIFIPVLILFGVRLGLLTFGLICITYSFFNFKSLLNLKNLLILAVILIASFFLINSNPYTSDKLYDSMATIGFGQAKEEVSEIGEDYHNIGLRSQIWQTSLELIQERPIIGYGAGTEKNILLKRNTEKENGISKFHSHNQFLSIAFQYGIVGLISFCLVLLFLLKYSLKHVHYVLIFTILTSSMITDTYFDVQQGIFYFSLFASLILIDSSSNVFKKKITYER
jgi:O-antigen ligase